ncbi:MAG: hypothetical protein WAM60_08740 [Candidatus Promineifilaceae bacterium]
MSDEKKAKALIQSDLKRRNRKPVEITKCSNYSKQTRPAKYKVSYVTAGNDMYKAYCVLWASGELYWSDPIFTRKVSSVETYNLIRWNDGSENVPVKLIPSDKEEIIDGLTSNYRYERLQMAQQVGNLDTVDELVVYILQDMANDDPDLAVRQAAQEAAQNLTLEEKAIV